MNRINHRLAEYKKTGRKALVSYLVAGDPRKDVTVATMHALVAAGTDIIEVGVPFSDPMAEGLVIQLAHERALEHNTSLRDTLAMVAEFRLDDQDTPIVLMGYANPVVRMGYKAFAQAAKQAGVDGLLTVDLPPEEAEELSAELKPVEIEIIFLIAPTTEEARIRMVAKLAGGFLYYVSLKGVTGAGNLDIQSVKDKLTLIRSITDLPVCVGFGIKDGASAKAVAEVSDGAVVGSVLVNKMASLAGESVSVVAEQTALPLIEMRQALDSLK